MFKTSDFFRWVTVIVGYTILGTITGLTTDNITAAWTLGCISGMIMLSINETLREGLKPK